MLCFNMPTLYSTIPNVKLIKTLFEAIDFCFKGVRNNLERSENMMEGREDDEKLGSITFSQSSPNKYCYWQQYI